MIEHRERITLPDLISIVRLIAAPVLVVLAYRGNGELFIGILVFSMLTDALDGYFARKLHSESISGSILDSRADLATYSAILVGGYLLWPEMILAQKYYFGIVVVGYMLAMLTGLLKFRRIPSYHTWSTKISAVLLSISVLILYMFKISIYFRAAAILLVLAYVENICITLLLPHCRHDVPSAYHAFQISRTRRTRADG